MQTSIFAGVLAGFLLVGCGGRPEAAKERGFTLYEMQKYPDALPELEKAFEGGLDDPELVVRLAYCRVTVKGDAVPAIEILRDSALKFPNYARTYYELGFIAHQFGPTDDQMNVKQAKGFMLKAISHDSTDWKFLDNMGMFCFQLGDLDSAGYWYNRAKALNPDYPELNARLEQLAWVKARKAREDSLRALDTLHTEPKREPKEPAVKPASLTRTGNY